MYTKYHSKYYATELTLNRSSDSIDNLTMSLSNAKVDLNPHQIDAALFALKSPLSSGVILADEVGLGKTIEAGLVISQKWAERKRNILLVMPSSLRKQWNQELADKFYIDSIILESKSYKELKQNGCVNPFDVKNKVVICSYNFASKMGKDIFRVDWDLVVIDEAHRLRNVYKSSNKIANSIRESIQPYQKLLLTATPLQNSLMELYGLVSIIDKYAFGDKKSFREQFIRTNSEELRNKLLKKRLSQFCKRTLRKQVVEYVPYTERRSIVREYSPTHGEIKLYTDVSEYLRKDKLYALPVSQRHLMTLILRKLLASSTYAIADTLESLVKRLDDMLNKKAIYWDDELVNDFDLIEEIKDEWDELRDEVKEDYFIRDENERKAIEEEKKEVENFVKLAKSIEENTKGKELLMALKEGFDKGLENGVSEKAVVFTESRRTQEYLYELLTNHGYENQVVMINGSNTDKKSKEIYKEWIKRHDGEETIIGSKTADMKAAIVDEFRYRAKILIATEAAAEGINLQFCSLVVNYDLPWNPQRVEQRIGRCHRYGQKNDVVVINFVNIKNEADKRVYQLLDEKFKLFDGIFGASDEVLGAIESGVDFEKRISEIYQTCRSSEEIEDAFNKIQQELEEDISKTMNSTRITLLENFDEEVHEKLKGCKEDTDIKLSRYQQWMLGLAKAELEDEIEMELDNSRFYYNGSKFKNSYYDFNWKRAEETKSIFFRSDGSMINSLLQESLNRDLEVGYIDINYSKYKKDNGKITFYEKLKSKSGWLVIDKLSVEAFEKEERLIFNGVSDKGEILDEELSNKLLYIESVESKNRVINSLPKEIIEERKKLLLAKHKTEIESKNMKYFDEQEEKLDAWAEDLKKGLEKEIEDIEKEIKEIKREARHCPSLEDKVRMKKEIKELEKKRNKKRRELYNDQDKIEEQKDELIEQMEAQIRKKEHLENVLVLRWNLI